MGIVCHKREFDPAFLYGLSPSQINRRLFCDRLKQSIRQASAVLDERAKTKLFCGSLFLYCLGGA